MSSKVSFIIVLAALTVSPLIAEEATAPAAAAQENPEFEAEMSYIRALIDNAYPDIAGPLIEETKKRWPAYEARFFAVEIRSILSLGQFEAAEKMIAALPDRKSTKYWAARLQMANSYFTRGQKPECMKIYEEFFKVFAKPPAEIRGFYFEACYAYGQLLALDKQYAKAAQRYEALLAQQQKGSPEWCNVGCETVDLYLRLADQQTDPKQKKAREASLNAAEKIVDQLLWKLDEPLIFGRAVSMKAHLAQMRGNVEKASSIIDDYRQSLEEIHEQLVAADPDGKLGYLRASPLPECLFLQAKILWDEAQAEYKKPKRDDEKVKSLMFGPRGKNGKRQVKKGAFAMAQTVFLDYDSSSWAPQAGDLAQAVSEFAKAKYNANIKCKITPEQVAKARARQFADGNEKFLAQDYEAAIASYSQALAKYPEIKESVSAVENIASSFLDLILQTKDEAKKAECRLNADAVEGYLSERFAGAKDRSLMMAGGDATLRLIAKERQYKNAARADWLQTEFLTNYRRHTNAGTHALKWATDAQKAERYRDAIKYWNLICAYYTNSAHYATALSQLSVCCGKIGDKEGEVANLTKYLTVETVKLRRLQAQFNLAKIYQQNGLNTLATAAEKTDAAEIEDLEKRGTAQIVRAIQNFSGFRKEADKALADPATSKEDAEKYRNLRESAMFMVGLCWRRMTRPADKLEAYRKRAAEGYEAYVKEYPEGKFAKACYVDLGTIYTALGDMAKSKDALDRLSQKYPDSDEAKNAKPRLAKNLIEMGMKREGAEIYAEMLRTDGAYSAGQFVLAGEALIEAKNWDLASQAFEKAIRLAGTNSVTTVAKARLGQAKSAWKQGSLAEAREALDLFLADPKMSRMAIAADANFMLVEVASDQGRVEKDATMRGKCFGAAIGALKKVRQYWAKKPQWEQDTLNLLSGDVLVDRMKAEEAMGLKEEALETCGRAASTFQAFLQSHPITADRSIDKMEAGEVANLERAYATLVPLFAKMGPAQADRVMTYGKEYLDLFPNGSARTVVQNCMNQAKADLPAKK